MRTTKNNKYFPNASSFRLTKKKKVGVAFSDFVSHDSGGRKTAQRGNIFSEVLHITPLIILLIVFGIIVFRLFYLQVLRHDYYSKLSDRNRTRTAIIPAPRGIIFDRDGKALVRNAPTFKVVENGKVRLIDKSEAVELSSKGVEVLNEVERNYLYKDAFAHVIGYTGQISEDEILLPQFETYSISDFLGKMGIEKQYESTLHGQNGKELFEVDATGKESRSLGKQEAESGRDILTTLDVDVQLAAHDALKDVEKGAVVVSDPRSGAIRALYSKPSFDPNLFTHPDSYKPVGEYDDVSEILLDGEKQPLLDRAISGLYPPGSTYKLVTAIAALEEGGMKKDTLIEDTGVLRVGAFSFGNWYFLQYGRTDGMVDVIKAISRSNDIYFYKAAEETGIQNLSRWSRVFGLGKTTGVDLPGELNGTIPDPTWKKENIGEVWYLGDTYNMGIGQGYILSTPLQINMMTIPFANDGTLYKPHIVAGEKHVVKKDFMKKENKDLVRAGMKSSCEEGGVAFPFFDFKVKNDSLPIDGKNYIESSSGSAQMTRIVVGCKTGTAEAGGDRDPHAWITVFAPYYNPEVVITVLVENKGEGSSVAGPIARDVLERYFETK